MGKPSTRRVSRPASLHCFAILPHSKRGSSSVPDSPRGKCHPLKCPVVSAAACVFTAPWVERPSLSALRCSLAAYFPAETVQTLPYTGCMSGGPRCRLSCRQGRREAPVSTKWEERQTFKAHWQKCSWIWPCVVARLPCGAMTKESTLFPQ